LESTLLVPIDPAVPLAPRRRKPPELIAIDDPERVVFALTSKVPPEISMVLVPSVPFPERRSVPLLTVVVPAKLLAPLSVTVPLPALARFPAPWIWPSKVEFELLASVSVWPDARTTEPPMAPPPDKVAAVWLAFTERVAPAIFPITRLDELPTALAPERTSEPLWTDTVPLKEFVPARMVVPAPACRSVPFPEMPLAKSVPWVSVLER